jgi:hypothetical protein
MTVGSEMRPAVVAASATEEIFAGDIGGVSFVTPSVLRPRLQGNPAVFTAIRQQVTTNLPADFGPDGKTRTLLESKTVGGVEQSEKQVVTLREGTAASSLAAEQLDPSLLSGLDADYVLISVPFGAYVDMTRIAALYAILPLSGSGHLISLTPRGLFALYDCTTGRKVWEGQIGSLAPEDTSKGLDRRVHPILGAAYLLTGDIETPLVRLLHTTPASP